MLVFIKYYGIWLPSFIAVQNVETLTRRSSDHQMWIFKGPLPLIFEPCMNITAQNPKLFKNNSWSSQILIVFTILFGTTKFKLSYSEYVTILSLMGFLTGVTLFSWMVVFTFRKNLLMAAKYSLAPVQNTTGIKQKRQDWRMQYLPLLFVLRVCQENKKMCRYLFFRKMMSFCKYLEKFFFDMYGMVTTM